PDETPGARVGLPVHRGQPALVEGLAPELDEYGPDVAVVHRGTQTRADDRPEPPPRVAGPARLGGHAAVEVHGHAPGGRGQHCGLVAEVVVEDPLAHRGLHRHPLHGEAGVAVAGQAPDGGADDLLAPYRSHAEPGGHAGCLQVFDWSVDQLSRRKYAMSRRDESRADGESTGRRGRSARAAPALRGALRLQAPALRARMIRVSHGRGEGPMPGLLRDEAVHRLADAPVRRMPL